MKYPERLLPKPNYKRIQDFTELQDKALIRFFYKEDTEELTLKKIASPREQILDLSTNLLGIFKEKDIFIKIIRKEKNPKDNYFLQDWKEGTQVKVPQYKKDFYFFFNRGYFFLKISDINGQSYTYEDQNHNIYKYTCKVTHSPTNSNFWHCSLNWFSDDGDNIINLKKKHKRRIANAIRRQLIKFAKTKIENYDYSINKSLYSK